MYEERLRRIENDLQEFKCDHLSYRRLQEELYVKDVLRHSVAVAQISKQIAKTIGLSPQEQDLVYTAALFHDVGKVTVPQSILFKTDPLTQEDFAEIRKHTIYGANFLESRGYSDIIVATALSHHERIDALGYPGHVTANSLPLATRIVSVADVYDAMSSPRVYRAAISAADIKKELTRIKGSQLDAGLVDALLTSLEQHSVHAA